MPEAPRSASRSKEHSYNTRTSPTQFYSTLDPVTYKTRNSPTQLYTTRDPLTFTTRNSSPHSHTSLATPGSGESGGTSLAPDSLAPSGEEGAIKEQSLFSSRSFQMIGKVSSNDDRHYGAYGAAKACGTELAYGMCGAELAYGTAVPYCMCGTELACCTAPQYES
eukprot:1934215-Rhodomonas_salina.1